MSDRETPRVLVLDTSVAVKFYLAEDLMEEAGQLRTAVADEAAELIAPSTIQPEFWNAPGSSTAAAVSPSKKCGTLGGSSPKTPSLSSR